MNREKIIALEEKIAHDYPNTAALVVLKDGNPLYQGGFNGHSPTEPIHLASVTKSIFSALVGIAIELGYLAGTGVKVLDFFPHYRPRAGEEILQQLTLRELLTMTAPYRYGTEPYEGFFMSEDWITFALDQLGGPGKIGDFTYAAIIGPHILSGILTKATGRSVYAFAEEHLFTPLGIWVGGSVVLHSPEEQLAFFGTPGASGWAADSQGINPAGWGLTLSAVDLAKIGQLYLQKGRWEGAQILPAHWVEESTRLQSRWGELGYGYLWWVPQGESPCYAALGDGGNVLYCSPTKGLVIASTALFVPGAADRMDWIEGYLLPLFSHWEG